MRIKKWQNFIKNTYFSNPENCKAKDPEVCVLEGKLEEIHEKMGLKQGYVNKLGTLRVFYLIV